MDRRLRIAVVIGAALAALAYGDGALLFVLPALLLMAVLAVGCFPGERKVLARRRRAATDRRRVVPRTLGSPGRTPHSICPAGTALLAFKRAVRPPPSLVVAV